MASSAGAGRGGLWAWAFYDWANTAYATMIQTFVFAAYFTGRVAESEQAGTEQWGVALGAAGLLVALSAPFLGAVADRGGPRKPWLATFTALCVTATALLGTVRPDAGHVPRALVLVFLAAVGSELSSVFYNAMLPGLAPHGRVGRWSGRGWALGYAGGLGCLLVALFGLLGDSPWLPLEDASAEPVRAAVVLAAAWYAVFALPLFLFTPDVAGRGRPPQRAAREGLRQLVRTFREARRHAGLFRFLVARMLYVDGLGTLFSFGGVFAAGTFGLGEREVLEFGIALNVSAGVGAALLARLDDRLGGRRTAALSLVGLLVSGIVAVAAPTAGTFFAAAVVLGLFVGPVQAASRSYLARTAPPALRNQMFGLYAFSGKVTAFVGPLLVAALTRVSGSQRVGMSVVLMLFAAGLALLLGVPDDKDRSSAGGAPPSGAPPSG